MQAILSILLIFILLTCISILMIRHGYFPTVFPEYSSLYSGVLTVADGLPEGITITFSRATKEPHVVHLSDTHHVIFFGNLDVTIVERAGNNRSIDLHDIKNIKIDIRDLISNQHIYLG